MRGRVDPRTAAKREQLMLKFKKSQSGLTNIQIAVLDPQKVVSILPFKANGSGSNAASNVSQTGIENIFLKLMMYQINVLETLKRRCCVRTMNQLRY